MKAQKPHVDSLRTYFLIFAALMILLVATVWASAFDLGSGNAAIALTIAVAKALLVILFFMHVRHGSGLVWVFAGAAFVWLSLLLGLTMTDYLSRGPRTINPADTSQTNWPIRSTETATATP
jgi:cytochrome c oxidase subunit 4